MIASSGCRPAFSLIELLCVIMLIALAMGVGIWHASTSDPRLRTLQLAAQVENADRFARQAAVSQGPCSLRCTDRVTLTILLADDRTPIYERNLGGATLTITDNHMTLLPAVAYDALGRSRDFIFTITGGDQARSWRVCGQTGWPEETPP